MTPDHEDTGHGDKATSSFRLSLFRLSSWIIKLQGLFSRFCLACLLPASPAFCLTQASLYKRADRPFAVNRISVRKPALCSPAGFVAAALSQRDAPLPLSTMRCLVGKMAMAGLPCHLPLSAAPVSATPDRSRAPKRAIGRLPARAGPFRGRCKRFAPGSFSRHDSLSMMRPGPEI